MPRFSANLGFLWNDLALPDAIRAAAAAGFEAVECHWPYAEDPALVRAALRETGLPMLGLNTAKGPPGAFGLSAVPGREAEAERAIAQAFDFAEAIGARAVHVMAGVAERSDANRAIFARHLALACERAARIGATVLIEPLNARDVPGYFLLDLDEAARILALVARPELRVMFDCYHMQVGGGDLLRRFEAHRDQIGHVQIAAAPTRAEPDEGEVAYERLLPLLEAAGYRGFFGAEYRPRAAVEDGLSWLRRWR